MNSRNRLRIGSLLPSFFLILLLTVFQSLGQRAWGYGYAQGSPYGFYWPTTPIDWPDVRASAYLDLQDGITCGASVNYWHADSSVYPANCTQAYYHDNRSWSTHAYACGERYWEWDGPPGTAPGLHCEFAFAADVYAACGAGVTNADPNTQVNVNSHGSAGWCVWDSGGTEYWDDWTYGEGSISAGASGDVTKPVYGTYSRSRSSGFDSSLYMPIDFQHYDYLDSSDPQSCVGCQLYYDGSDFHYYAAFNTDEGNAYLLIGASVSADGVISWDNYVGRGARVDFGGMYEGAAGFTNLVVDGISVTSLP